MMIKIMSQKSILLALIVCVTIAFAQVQDDGQANGEVNQQERSSGLLSHILSPIKETIRQAKRLFSGRLSENVNHGIDRVQQRAFKMFMSLYNKSYSPEEIPRRMALFFERRKEIEQSVKLFREGKLPFVMRENAFIDWEDQELKMLAGVSPPQPEELTQEEREAQVSTPQPEVTEEELVVDNNNASAQVRVARSTDGNDGDTNLIVKQNERIPVQKDWRDSGCVAEPINQMKCGACYAIATMNVLESQRCINKVSSPILAPQQAVDCSRAYGNFGCDGGWPTRVLRYLQDIRVAARETCYPFVRRQGSCRLRTVSQTEGCSVSASPTDTSLKYKILNNERDILYHVAKTGPVVTVMKATDKFLYYGSGIFDDTKCSRRRDDVDHAISIVGYGKENGQNYWLIKNSWGVREWGEKGYGKYRRGTNACSIGHWGWVITS